MTRNDSNDPTGRKCRVLLVDDSPVILGLLSRGLARHPDLDVVGTAVDAYDAREKIKALDPDVITLDVQMPKMSGLDFLERIMRLRPMPVVMFSSITRKGSAAAVRALSLGAVDVQVKPESGLDEAFMQDFSERIIRASRSTLAAAPRRDPIAANAPQPVPFDRWNGKLVLIGASTGGVAALEAVLNRLPANAPPIVVSQHMPEMFLRSFVERLDQKNAMKVQVAVDGTVLQQGHVYMAPGGDRHTVVARRGKSYVCRDLEGPKTNGHYPSVDELFLSAKEFAELTIGVILTGLGRDGADGLKALHDAGAATIGQDKESCVVYGMPKAARDLGAVDKELALPDIARQICKLTDKSVVSA